jgi:hypothetical protein
VGFQEAAGRRLGEQIEDSWMLWTGLTLGSCVEIPAWCVDVKGILMLLEALRRYCYSLS